MKTSDRIYSFVLVISFFYLRPAREIETSSSSFSNTRRAMVRKLVHDTLIFSLVVLVLLFVCVWTALEFCSGHSHLSLITLLQGRSPLHLYSSIPLWAWSSVSQLARSHGIFSLVVDDPFLNVMRFNYQVFIAVVSTLLGEITTQCSWHIFT